MITKMILQTSNRRRICTGCGGVIVDGEKYWRSTDEYCSITEHVTCPEIIYTATGEEYHYFNSKPGYSV